MALTMLGHDLFVATLPCVCLRGFSSSTILGLGESAAVFFLEEIVNGALCGRWRRACQRC